MSEKTVRKDKVVIFEPGSAIKIAGKLMLIFEVYEK
jgi:hypothetical protein